MIDELSKQLGQPIVIENRAGAGGTLGATAVARAAPDGYTVLLYSSSFSISHSIHANLPYDTLNDFTPVVPFGAAADRAGDGAGQGFQDPGRAGRRPPRPKPGAMSFASAGIGAASHMAAERFRVSAGFEALHVPFRGPTDALTAAMTGQVDFYFLPIAPALPLIQDGKLDRARREHGKARLGTAGRADDHRGGPEGLGLRFLDRTVRAGEDAARDRHPAARRDAEGARRALGQGPLRQARRRADAHDPEEFATYFHADVEDIAKLVKAAKIPTQERN